VLVVLVMVPDNHVLDAVRVVPATIEVLGRDAGHLLVRQRGVAAGEAQGDMLDGLRDVGALLPDRLELSRELAAGAPGHVPADDLRLLLWSESVSLVEHVASRAPEAAAPGDLGDHGSPPSAESVVPSTSARTPPRRRVTSSSASTTSGAPGSRRRSAMRRAIVLMSAARRPSA